MTRPLLASALWLAVSAHALAVPAPSLPVPPSKPLPQPAATAKPSAAAAADQPDVGAIGLSATEQRLLTAQVLLDRAHFSVGSIDAADGSNMRGAADAYRAAKKLAPGADIVAPLSGDDHGPVLARYTITADDTAGPFAPTPKGFEEMAKLKSLGYESPLEELGERFHAAPALLKRLNPGADFTRVGQAITVPAIEREKLAQKVAMIEVDKTRQQLRAFDEGGALIAVFPATVGSTERPAPDGTWKVVTVAPRPTYTYDPTRLTFGKKSMGKLTIAAGPNNPVGATWIALSKPTYGIHGTPDPELVGKRASHGCVRLTNWDAVELGAAVKAGTKVVFVGQEQRG